MSVNSTHKEIYIQLRAILDGCDTVLDTIPFCNMYAEAYPHMKSMIFSYANGRIYNDNIDIKTKQNILNDVMLCDTKEDAVNLISIAMDRSTDDVYKRTMERLANRKHYKKIDHTSNNTLVNVCKKCPHPHCNHIANMPEDTQYIICGYTNPNHGYDWNGCGKDWCFQCEKMLCKSWEINQLHLAMNRTHNDECCAKHASVNGHRYPDDYCQCNNSHVHKKMNDIMKTLNLV